MIPSVYTGLNDMPSLGTVTASSSVKNIGGDGSISGDWLLVFVQALDKSQQANHVKSRVSLNIGDAWRPFISEEFNTMTEVYNRYPALGPYTTKEELLAALPSYYGFIIKITQFAFDYYCYSASYDTDDNKYYMTWNLVNPEYHRAKQFAWSNLTDFDAYGDSIARNAALTPPVHLPVGYKWFDTTDKKLYVVEQLVYGTSKFWYAIPAYRTGITSYGTAVARPSNPSYGYRYANTTLKQIQEYYANDPFSGEEYNIVLDDVPMKNVVNVFPNQPVIIFALPLQTTNSSSVNDKNLLSALAFKSLEWYNGTAWQSYNILSARIINGNSMIKKFNDRR